MGQWAEGRTGLIIPAAIHRQEEDSARERTLHAEAGERKRSWRFAYGQAIIAFAALVFGLPSLWFTYGTLRDQQRINDRQDDRFDRRYAGRVAWWFDDSTLFMGSEYPILYFQNRAPIPLTDVIVMHTGWDDDNAPRARDFGYKPVITDYADLVYFPDVPPCVIFKVELNTPGLISAFGYSRRVDSDTGEVEWTVYHQSSTEIFFSDPVNSWSKRYSYPAERARFDSFYRLGTVSISRKGGTGRETTERYSTGGEDEAVSPTSVTQQDVEDCGEAS